jgi:hypothetical protein
LTFGVIPAKIIHGRKYVPEYAFAVSLTTTIPSLLLKQRGQREKRQAKNSPQN